MAAAWETVPLLAERVAARFLPLAPEVRADWTRFNPSVLQLRDGRTVTTVRSSNYRIGAGGRYEIPGDGVVRTETLLLELDEELAVASARQIDLTAPPEVGGRIRGLEDLRICEGPAGLVAIATARDRDADGISRAVLVELAPEGGVARERVIPGPDPRRHEKNWVPFADDAGTIRVVYGWDPLVVGVLDLDAGAVDWADPVPSGWRDARGGGGGAAFATGSQSGRLFVVHEVVVLPDWTRRYLHRFVAIDLDGTPLAASAHFAFLGHGIEFAAGLTIRGERVLVSFGREDEEAWLASIALSDILHRMLGFESGVRP